MSRAPRAPYGGLLAAVVLAAVTVTSAGGGTVPASKPAIHTLAVPRDKPLEVVYGPPKSTRAIVYLHGVCGDPTAFRSWAAAAAAHGTLISLRGDSACADRPGRHQWTYNWGRHDRRIRRAIEVVNRERQARHEVALRSDEVALIGYSQGARRVEWLAWRYPKRYRRVAIIAVVSEPALARLAKAHSILLMAGAKDARRHIKAGCAKLEAAGKRVRYLELPGAGHGEYGASASPVMKKALDWLFKKVP